MPQLALNLTLGSTWTGSDLGFSCDGFPSTVGNKSVHCRLFHTGSPVLKLPPCKLVSADSVQFLAELRSSDTARSNQPATAWQDGSATLLADCFLNLRWQDCSVCASSITVWRWPSPMLRARIGCPDDWRFWFRWWTDGSLHWRGSSLKEGLHTRRRKQKIGWLQMTRWWLWPKYDQVPVLLFEQLRQSLTQEPTRSRLGVADSSQSDFSTAGEVTLKT